MAQAFSEQLRQAVRDCGTSRYALARQLSISESTLSRFLSGERGLTLDLLDRLANVLGLQIVVTMQRASRPSRRGPKPKGEKKMTAKAKVDWELLAQVSARDACENNFSSRRGIYYYEDADVLCVYNNNPYAENPSLRTSKRRSFGAGSSSKASKSWRTLPTPKPEMMQVTLMQCCSMCMRNDKRKWPRRWKQLSWNLGNGPKA